MWSRCWTIHKTNANSSTIFVFEIKLRAIDLAYNRRDSAKCDLVLVRYKTNANSSTIFVFNPVARYWFGYNRRDSTKCDLVLYDTKTNANSSTIFVFESSCALLIWPIIDAILQNVISFWYDTKTNANSSTIFVFNIQLRAIDLAYNRCDSAKCDLVLYDTKTNANSSTIFVFESSCALLIWPIIDAILQNVISFWTIQKQTPTLVPFSCLDIKLRAIDLA